MLWGWSWTSLRLKHSRDQWRPRKRRSSSLRLQICYLLHLLAMLKQVRKQKENISLPDMALLFSMMRRIIGEQVCPKTEHEARAKANCAAIIHTMCDVAESPTLPQSERRSLLRQIIQWLAEPRLMDNKEAAPKLERFCRRHKASLLDPVLWVEAWREKMGG